MDDPPIPVMSLRPKRYGQGMRFRLPVLTLVCLAIHVGWAATYTVSSDPGSREAVVEVSLDGASSTEFRMAAWAPGDYRIVNFGTVLSQVTFYRGGNVVQAQKSDDPNRWSIPTGADRVTYRVNARTSIFTEDLRVTAREMFFSGPAVLGWFQGHQNEKHTLKIALQPAGAIAECALDRIESSDPQYAVFTAPDYDVLVDSPVIVGTTIKVKEFKVMGKPHYIVAFNRSESIDLDAWARMAARIVEETGRFFGGLPYKRYLFMLDVAGPGGGLEHAASTRMAVRTNASPLSSAEFLAHEFFHTWNVKQIRPRVLGPFDYTKPAITGSIWWLEGVTDYYARVISLRAGLRTKREFLDSLANDMFLLSREPRRFQVSADQSSRRVWEANNSSGFGVDYYIKGALIGMMLDMAIRAETRNERSLDDVMLALWNETRDGRPGFAEGRIRELCVLFGGHVLGEIYDEAVMRAVEMPWERVLPRFGLIYRERRLDEDPSANQSALDLYLRWPYRTS